MSDEPFVFSSAADSQSARVRKPSSEPRGTSSLATLPAQRPTNNLSWAVGR